MKISYYTLSGSKNTIDLNSNSTIYDLKSSIRSLDGLYLNTFIHVFSNNQLKRDFDFIDQLEYYIIYEDYFYDLKSRINNHQLLNISHSSFDTILKYLDLDLLSNIHIIIDYLCLNSPPYFRQSYIVKLCTHIIQYKDLKMVKLLVLLNFDLNNLFLDDHIGICDLAAGNSDLNILIFLYEFNHFKLTHYAFYHAISYNSLPDSIKIIKYLIHINCDYNINLYKFLITQNKLHFIKYFDKMHFRSNKCWDNILCEFVIYKNSPLKFLKYFCKTHFNLSHFIPYHIHNYKKILDLCISNSSLSSYTSLHFDYSHGGYLSTTSFDYIDYHKYTYLKRNRLKIYNFLYSKFKQLSLIYI